MVLSLRHLRAKSLEYWQTLASFADTICALGIPQGVGMEASGRAGGDRLYTGANISSQTTVRLFSGSGCTTVVLRVSVCYFVENPGHGWMLVHVTFCVKEKSNIAFL